MKITALAPWFGSKRTLAPRIVAEMGSHAYYFECCAGSMAVLFAKEPSEHETVCDMHGDLTNLAFVIQDEFHAKLLFERLQTTLMCDELYTASQHALEKDFSFAVESKIDTDRFDRAYHYFIASWMGRNGVSGTARINYQIATRWTQGGGSGPLRFKNAVDSIPAWCERLRNVHILRRDIFDVLPKIEDEDGVAIYADPPYLPETMSGNSRYVHDFKPEDHERLAAELRRFKRARVVVSYYAHKSLEHLYQGWSFADCSRQLRLSVQNKRGMGRKQVPEVLIVNGPLVGEMASQEAESLF